MSEKKASPEAQPSEADSPQTDSQQDEGLPSTLDEQFEQLLERLQGIDAPEAAQVCRQGGGQRYLCGDRATQALRA